MTQNASLQFMKYKTLHKTHYTGKIMFDMGHTHTSAQSAHLNHQTVIWMLFGFVHLSAIFGKGFVNT